MLDKIQKELQNNLKLLIIETKKQLKEKLFKELKQYNKALEKDKFYDASNSLSYLKDIIFETVTEFGAKLKNIQTKYEPQLKLNYKPDIKDDNKEKINELNKEKEKLLKRLNEIEEILKQIK